MCSSDLPRWAENYRFLENESKRTDAFDSLRYVALGDSAWLQTGGEIRYRADAINKPFFGLRGINDDSYLQQRLQLHGDLHLFDGRLRVFGQLQDSRTWGKDLYAPFDESRTEFQQFFVDWKLALPANYHLTTRLGRQELAYGSLMLINNQVDSSTGTVQLKASFPNAGNTLWPGTFVNVHLTIAVRHNALTVPLTAVRQGPDGAFAYTVGPNNVVGIRNVTTGQSRDGQVLIEQGLAANETVVTAGQYRLNPGTTVEIVPDDKKDQVQDATTASAGMLP
mgnify:CR=1 FL=1